MSLRGRSEPISGPPIHDREQAKRVVLEIVGGCWGDEQMAAEVVERLGIAHPDPEVRLEIERLKGRIRGFEHHDKRATAELDAAGIEKFDDYEPTDSTDECVGQEWSLWKRIRWLRERAERAEERLRAADGTIRELWRSYRSLVANTGREDALRWDGPCVARNYLGEGAVLSVGQEQDKP